MLTEFARFENLNADTANKTKIVHDKIPSILSRQFQFCRLMRIGPNSTSFQYFFKDFYEFLKKKKERNPTGPL